MPYGGMYTCPLGARKKPRKNAKGRDDEDGGEKEMGRFINTFRRAAWTRTTLYNTSSLTPSADDKNP